MQKKIRLFFWLGFWYFLLGYLYSFRIFLLIYGYFFILFLMLDLNEDTDVLIFLFCCFSLYYFYWIVWEANIPTILTTFTLLYTISVNLHNKDFLGIFWIIIFLFIFNYFI